MSVRLVLRSGVLCGLMFASSCLSSADSPTMSVLRIECVEMRFDAATKRLSSMQIDDLFDEAKRITPKLSAGYSVSSRFFVWAFVKDADAMMNLIERVATEPRAQWKITVQVHRSAPHRPRPVKMLSEEDRKHLAERRIKARI